MVRYSSQTETLFWNKSDSVRGRLPAGHFEEFLPQERGLRTVLHGPIATVEIPFASTTSAAATSAVEKPKLVFLPQRLQLCAKVVHAVCSRYCSPWKPISSDSWAGCAVPSRSGAHEGLSQAGVTRAADAAASCVRLLLELVCPAAM